MFKWIDDDTPITMKEINGRGELMTLIVFISFFSVLVSFLIGTVLTTVFLIMLTVLLDTELNRLKLYKQLLLLNKKTKR